jgi:hypothetical protein
MALAINFPAVTTVNIPVLIDSVGSSLLILEVAHHSVTSTHADLALAVLVRIVDLEVGARASKPS